MIGTSLALKIAVPVLLVTGGVVALVTVPDAGPAAASAQLWIDSPADAARVRPGPVTVVAHAADELALDAMTLEVDGTEVATQSDLATYDRLASVRFTWQATDGEHFLVVTGGGKRSAPVAVVVGDATRIGTPTSTRGPSASPSATPTASATPATSTPTPSRAPSASPTKAPTTAAPPRDPQIFSVAVTPSNVSGGACTGTITVTANVRYATGGSAQVISEGAAGIDQNIGGSVSGNTFTATFKQRDLTGNNLSGPFRIEVTVTNANGFDVSATGLQIACAKD